MPELPEVETIRRQLAPALRGKRIERLEVIDSKWGSPIAASELAGLIESRTIEQLSRRGKYLIFDLGDELYLICHLRMTGNFLYDADPAVAYQRAVFELGGGHTLRFTDPRRFGTAEVIIGAGALDEYFAGRLGIEPFSGALDGTALKSLALGKRTSIKAFLLDQRAVAGIGNIYADEALFRAEVHPLREAGRLKPAQYELLATTIQDALQAGLDAGGATIDDFRHADGVYGSFQDEFLVHRRAGEPCPRCGNEVEKIVVAGRGTYVCGRCQTRPRGAVTRRAAPRASRSGQRR
ncbi:MAG: bifunctional DNA-formamidopyrimidine glycosylase/DNA-(apurinic or apyrimidinic site) lyase [Solirubrobacteraceae bacterium]|nr:bifunctional DNA-formamidopyrimidine glycosylase/DNA-(apurinic or apyrimidinic site) lyase [Solirubrobacteraceae bacterium]